MSLDDRQLEQHLTRFILEELVRDQAISELEPDDELLESSLIDSLGIMRLIAFIEHQFGYSVPSSDVVIENFLSVSAIVGYLTPRLEADAK